MKLKRNWKSMTFSQLKREILKLCKLIWFASYHKYFRACDLPGDADIVIYWFIEDYLSDEMKLKKKIDLLFRYVSLFENFDFLKNALRFAYRDLKKYGKG